MRTKKIIMHVIERQQEESDLQLKEKVRDMEVKIVVEKEIT